MKSSGHPGFLHISRHSFICHPSSAPPTSRITKIGSQRTSSPQHFATLIQKPPAGLQSTNKYYTRTFAKAFKSEQGFISALPGASSFYHSRDSQLPDTTALLTRRADNTAWRQTAQIYKSAPSPHIVLQSSVGIWSAALVCGIIGSAVTYFLYHTELGQGKDAEQITTNLLEQLDIFTENWSKMTAEALPGRPGTLTPDQEDKLKEFWVATLKVFGVLDESEAKAAIENGDGRVRSDTTSTTDKKPKKRKALFSRKKKDDDKNSPTTDPGDKITDVEDKYGQTREFHDALANMSPETLRTTFWSMVKHDHPDALLLRFLRARKWDLERALVMMVSTMRWRATEMHVDADIMVNGELGALEDEASDGPKKGLGHDFLAQMRMGKSFLHGTDNQGRPMCFVRVRLHKQGEQSEESLERYTVFLIESARMILNPPIDTAMVFFDMTGFGLSNMDYGPVKFMIKCFEANYPESLGVVLIHKAPWVFQGIWKIVKGWLDPVVASKVNFTNNLEDLEVYIPKSQIIKELGGEENWSYEYVEPVPGENAKMADTETRDKLLAERSKIYKEYEKATIEWISGEDEAKGKRNEIAKNLGQDYWQLDPYIRARSFYDRTGMLNPGGKVNFYPSRSSNGVAHVETEKPINGAVAVPIKPETSADDVD